MSDDLREVLSAAIDSHAEAEPEAVEPVESQPEAAEREVKAEPTEETDSERADRERDERGRFKAKQAAEAAEEAAEVAAPEVEAAPAVERKRPSSWKKELWEKYDRADPELQEYILQREEEARRGVGMYRQKAEFAEKLEREFVPYTDLMQRLQTTPENVVRSLMQTASILYTGDKLTKAALIQKLAVDHGLTSADFEQAQQAGPGAISAQQEALHYKAELERMKAETAAQQQAALVNQIEDFRGTHPGFDAVQNEMAGLLTAGIAMDLQDAYDKALRLNPQPVAPQAPSQREKATRAAQAAKAAAVSPRSTTATLTTTQPLDRRDAILAAFEQHAPTSRV